MGAIHVKNKHKYTLKQSLDSELSFRIKRFDIIEI